MKLGFNTKRLKMHPMTDEEIQLLIVKTHNEELKQAYTAMLESCIANPKDRAWYAPWAIELKNNGAHVGEVSFRGPALNDAVEIGYGVRSEYESKGYATEAVNAMISWAFEHKEVIFIEAETTPGNLASIRILEGQGFTKYGEGDEGDRYFKTRPTTQLATVYMSVGLCLGMSIGMTAFDNMTLGLCIGMALGFALGTAQDKQNKKALEDALARRNKKEEEPTEDISQEDDSQEK